MSGSSSLFLDLLCGDDVAGATAASPTTGKKEHQAGDQQVLLGHSLLGDRGQRCSTEGVPMPDRCAPYAARRRDAHGRRHSCRSRSGTLEVQLGDQRIMAFAGDLAWVPRGAPHTFASASDQPVHAVGFATPGGIEHLFSEQWQYLSSLTEPPDPTVMDEIGRRHKSPTVGPPITASGAPTG